MSERNGYEQGVPCWVAGVHPDPEQAVAFYAQLFGWEARDTMPPGSPGRYFMCSLRGRAVAAVGSGRGGSAPPMAAWGTHVWVDSADAAAGKVSEAGGSVLAEPFDLPQVARIAVLADPEGAVFCVWQPREHKAAQVVNEPGAWSMSALHNRDPEGAKRFYGEVFGWEPEAFAMDGAEVTLFRLPGYEGGEPGQPVPRDVIAVMAALGDDPSTAEVPAHWSPDFWVADAEETASKAEKLGGGVVMAPFDRAIFKSAVLADPQGAVFSVSQLLTPPAGSPA